MQVLLLLFAVMSGEAAPRPPVVRGIVVLENGKPAVRANVTLLPANVSVITDAQGAFAITTTHDWPEKATVALSGFGTKHIAIPKTHADVDLGRIELRRAATVAVSLDRSAYKGPLALLLMKDGAPAAYGSIAADAKSAELRDVEPGFYTLVARGEGPLEALGTGAGLRAGEVHRVTIAPQPRDVTLRVSRRGTPLAGAALHLKHGKSQWRTVVHAGADGAAKVALWEPGDFEIGVRGAGLTTPYIIRRPLRADALSIEVPDGVIAGAVMDSGANPVADAMVFLRTAREDGSTTVRTSTDAAGRFRFNAVDAGSHTINVQASGFLRPEPLAPAFGDELKILLERGVVREVRVAGPNGAPVAGAFVACATGSALRSDAITDEQGRASVATPAGTATLFVVPREGSFAFRRIGRDERHVRIDVPAAAASLEVATLTTEGKPIAGITVLMRYNGEIVPPDLALELERQQGARLRTDDTGRLRLVTVPRGVYEIWPYRSSVEADALLASASALEAPANVNVVKGDNKVTIRFRTKNRVD